MKEKFRCFSGILLLFLWSSECWILSLVPLPFVNPACTFESSQVMYCWKLAWNILTMTLLACDFSGGSDGRESAYNAGDLGLIPGLGKLPAEGNGNPLQYSCLENPMTEESGRLQFMGSQKVRHNWAISLHFAWNVPLVSLIFLKSSLVFPILLFSSISLHWSLRKAFLFLLAILWNAAFKWV